MKVAREVPKREPGEKPQCASGFLKGGPFQILVSSVQKGQPLSHTQQVDGLCDARWEPRGSPTLSPFLTCGSRTVLLLEAVLLSIHPLPLEVS